jgi:hypothetical protein
MFTYPAPQDAEQATVDLCDVRLLITDTEELLPMFQDHEITSFLRLAQGVVFIAAALALEHIASRTNLVLKRIKSLELETDGPATAKDLRAHAANLRIMHADGLDSPSSEFEDDEEGLFDFVELA